MDLNPKALRKLFKELEAQNWTIEAAGRGWKCKSPDGKKIVTVHGTVSDRRAGQNLLSEFRKGGYVPGKKAS